MKNWETNNFWKTYVAEITGKYNIKNAPTLEKLNLKIGAKVMILDNNIQEGYNNGTIATFQDSIQFSLC